jgi:hypothetical protein
VFAVHATLSAVDILGERYSLYNTRDARPRRLSMEVAVRQSHRLHLTNSTRHNIMNAQL